MYAEVWGVDDPFDQLHPPMPEVNLIDDDDDGGDNRPDGEGVWSGYQSTNAYGVGRKTFTVLMQPGNNYRAAATLLDDVFDPPPLTGPPQVDQTDADAKNQYGGAWSGYQVPVVWSKMLTVWRKLQVEFDSMGAEPTTWQEREPDWQHVFIEDLTVNAETTTLHLANSLSGNSDHQYEGGRIVIDENGFAFNVIDHTNNTVEISMRLDPPLWSYVNDHWAVLKDDDPSTGLLPYFYTIPPFIKNAYADAYVELVELLEQYNPDRSIAFDLYVTRAQMQSGLGWNNSKSQSSTDSFWTTFIMAGYQAGGNYLDPPWENSFRDMDPDPLVDNSNPSGATWPGDEYCEEEQAGWTATFGDWDSILFRATIDDLPQWNHFENQVLAHEIGHSAGNEGSEEQHHTEGGLMSASLHELHETFRAPTLKRFREVDKW